MQFGRILRYGLVYWVIGALIGFTELQFGLSRTALTVIFYIAGVLLPIIFFGLYFRRAPFVKSWKDGLALGIAWLILFTIIDSIVYIGFFKVSPSVYFSLNSLIHYVIFLVIGMVVAQYAVRSRERAKPEGLA